jgi:hydrogenase/urease accessory protein HupE
MTRVSVFTLLFTSAAAPAFAHDGAGVVHYLTQTDHVAGVIAAIALPIAFWLVLRGKRPEARRQKIRKD